MEKVLEDLMDPKLRERLTREFAMDKQEQDQFDNALKRRESVPVMAEVDRRPAVRRSNPILRRSVRNALGRSR